MIGRQDKRKTTLGIVHSYDDPATVLHHVPAMAVGSASIPPKMLKTILFAISGVFFFEMSRIQKQKLSRMKRHCREILDNFPLTNGLQEGSSDSVLKACTQMLVRFENEPDSAVSRIKMSEIHLPNGSFRLA